MGRHIPLIKRFQRYTVVIDDCLEWIGARNQGGYGVIQVNGRPCRAHRVAYEMAHGPIPDDLPLDHLCRNRACVRPDHLEVVTTAENNRRQKAQVPTCVNGHSKAGNRVRGQCRLCRRQQALERYHRIKVLKNPDRPPKEITP
jgi:hypothetical protein